MGGVGVGNLASVEAPRVGKMDFWTGLRSAHIGFEFYQVGPKKSRLKTDLNLCV